MKIKLILIIFTLVLACSAAIAVESTKNYDHDTMWLKRHGMTARIDDSECMSCHIDRIDCIVCHEDIKPRDHNSAFVNKSHGMKARWSRDTCNACHTDGTFCDDCHQVMPPSSHTPGWGGNIYGPNTTGRHCQNCHTMAKYGTTPLTRGCKTCHQVLPNNGNHTATMLP